MQFKDIAGQTKVKQKLIQTVKDGRISHAMLFLGEEGSGNLPMAIAYATYICCLNRSENDSCGQCSSCLKFNKLIHPDLHFSFPVNTGKLVSKDPSSNEYLSHWREFVLKNPYFHESQWYEFIGIENKQGFISGDESQQIIRKLSLKPYESEFKIMIIWLPEKMNPTAANKLLKLIEEPAENTVIIMAAESIETILPTILSRVQLIKFPRLENDELLAFLKYKNEINENTNIEDILHLANGNYLTALDFLYPDEDTSNYLNSFSEMMRTAFANDIKKMIDQTDEFASVGREKQKRFLEYSLRMFRENLALNLVENKIVYMDSNEMNFSKKFSAFINNENIFQINNLFSKALSDIESNGNARIIFMDIMLKLHGFIYKKVKR